MSSFSQVYDLANLRRAYRWVLSAQDARYKSYFRGDYAAYAVSSDTNLRLLRRRMRDGQFVPSHSSKVYLPKSTGVLRPLGLLTVNDQIAYQACINVVAEALSKRTKKRHLKTVFYHLYAGRSSLFFYRKWESAYRAYSNAIRANFNNGLKFVANFDLTAFYDSIDHQVLRQLLRRTGVDAQTTDFLLGCLRHWTESTWSAGARALIFHDHGIPQGPLSSGMLSEVVLQHLDKIGDGTAKDVKYLRYVDDIKIMAKDEKTLRRKLVALDIAAKEVGLFPQGTKITIREISDPEEEIKSVSQPPEPAAKPSATQTDVVIRIKELTKKGSVSDATRFKFVLARLTPSAATNNVLAAVMFKRPDLAASIVRHFAKYERLPKALARQVINQVLDEGVYHSVNADMLNLLRGRVRRVEEPMMADFAYERLFARKYHGRKYARPQPTYRAALLRWALLSSRMTYGDISATIASEADWGVLQDFLQALDERRLGKPSLQALINSALRRPEPDPSRVAASVLFAQSLSVSKPFESCTWSARILLRFAGLIPYAGRPPSLIPSVVAYTMKFTGAYDWQRLFGSDHSAAERFMLLSKQRYETDIDAFVVSLDSFFDLVLRHVFRHQGKTYSSTYGSYLGSSTPVWLKSTFPTLSLALHKLHQLRVRSFTAHPRYKTGPVNKRISHAQFYRVRKELTSALAELSSVMPL